VGYKHTNQRENSLFYNYKVKEGFRLEGQEAKFWIDTAKKEYFFTTDRKVAFEG